jgi:hypothetical protein
LRTLPVSAAIAHVWRSTSHNLWFALRAQWPWFVLLAVLFSVLASTVSIEFTGDQAAMEAQLKEHPERAGTFVFAIVTSVFAAMLAFSSIAVSWHRYVLLDEVPQGLAKLRVDALVWRYLGNIILITLMAAVAALPLTFVVLPLMSINPVLGGGAFMAYAVFVLLPVIYRLSIKLPAVALGEQRFRMGDAWNVSRGNWGQIVGLGLVYSLISWAIGLVLLGISTILVNVFGPTVGFWTDLALQVVVNWVLTVMGITLLTSLYGFFVEKRDF